MNHNNLMNAINDQIRYKSNLDLQRAYLGISKLSDCPRVILREYRNGIIPSEASYRFSFAGYEHERSILDLLKSAGIVDPDSFGKEVQAPWDARLRGHIDALTKEGELIEVKSVTVRKFEQIKSENRADQKHFVQAQLYLHYGGWKSGYIIYRCRETYEHHVISIHLTPEIARKYEEKAKRILAAIDSGALLACECGRCKG